MAALNGKWKLAEVQGFSDYMDAIGVSKENKEKGLKMLMPENNIVQEILIDGDDVSIKTITPLSTMEQKAKLNTEVNVTALDGRPMKATFKLDGEKLIEEQRGPFESTNIRFVQDGKLLMTQTANGITSTRKYNKV
ncbi:sodium/calcium exchanger regulatory protein 1-like [Saccostrea echinata]|uniref:sodium/calcium exchanger regulatory protein 1-like n=1 Tax=Saccostrea echinata TaxID=191078 RepID=UPI002A82384D|nr:sodium/calcium exchanger regulatory protein 1-like [Saccostrea echinata]